MGLLEDQPIPSDSKCPICGADPEYNPRHQLSASGYLHDDIEMTCSECGHQWPCGVPIGEYAGPLAEDLWCDSCDQRYALVHRVKPLPDDHDDDLEFHMKCPDEECYHFWMFTRKVGEGGVCLMGYPDITGNVDRAVSKYGHPPDDAE